MFKADSDTLWFGLLKTASNNIPVAYDPKLPHAPKKQIYLYNSQKDCILPYVREIVEPKLVDFENEVERGKIEKELKPKLKVATKKFLKANGSSVLPVAPSALKPEASDENILDEGKNKDEPEKNNDDGMGELEGEEWEEEL